MRSEMLDRLSYNSEHDTIFFAGDLLAKSSHASSISVIDFLVKHHKINGKETIFPVRGNHDQLIVQWRAWREWFEGLTLPTHPPFSFTVPSLLATQQVIPSGLRKIFSGSAEIDDSAPPVSTGREFLQLLEAEWVIARLEDDADPEEYAEVARKRARGTWREQWWQRIPMPGTGKEKQQWRLFGDHYWLARCGLALRP